MAIDFEELLFSQIRSEIEKWDTDGVYALFFGVHTNPADENIPHFVIGRGVENDITDDEDKWHLAVSAEDETEITADKETAQALTEWLHAQGVENIGYEDTENMYDELMQYIGKGPAGSYELIGLGVKIAQRLFEEGFIRQHFGKDIPIIFDDLETAWYNIEATEKANPEGLANAFLRKYAMHRKNSPKARAFAKFSMSTFEIFRIAAVLPITLFSSLFTLLFGGIHFPLGAGGIVKTTVFGVIFIFTLFSEFRRIKSYITEVKPTLRLLALRTADILLAAVCLFSCNFIADRAAAGLFVLICVLICAAGGSSMKKYMKNNGSEMRKILDKVQAEAVDKNDSENQNSEKESMKG